MGGKCPGLLGNTGPKCELPLRAAYSIGQASIALDPRAYPDWQHRLGCSVLRAQGQYSTHRGIMELALLRFCHVSFTVLETTSQNELLIQDYEKEKPKP